MTRIISVGAAVQDVFLSHSDAFTPVCVEPDKCFEQLPLGAKADVNQINFSTGGGATNASVTFARNGIDAVYMGVIGHDPAGVAVLDDLDKEGVDTSHIRYSNTHNTGYSVLLLAPNGERTILTYRGASTHYDTKAFDLSNTAADWMYISSLAGCMEVLESLVTSAKKSGIKIMINPGKSELQKIKQLRPLLEDIDVLLLNRDEMKLLVDGDKSEELVRRALSLVSTVIVSDGPNGVCASDGKTMISAGMYEDVSVLDRTGAGDAFGSGFLSQWATGKSLRDAIVFASANSTSVVQHIGAKKGILHKGVTLHDMDIKEEVL